MDCFFDKYVILAKTVGLFPTLHNQGIVNGINLIFGSGYPWIKLYPRYYIGAVEWAFYAFWHF